MPFSLRILFLLVAAVCCLGVPSVAAQTVLFDESHGQPFVTSRSGALDLSDLAALYQANGFTVTNHADGLTRETLSSVDVLVLSGPFLPLSDRELEAVVEFVNAGGGLAILLHIAPPVARLLHALDVDFTNGTLREPSQAIDGNPLNFKVVNMAEHPVTEGLDSFSAYGAWALRGTAPHSKIIAETSQYSWVDLSRDNQLSKGEPVQAFGVMVAGSIGHGRYVVIGDDALFQNRFFTDSNRQLALQLIHWLGSE